jgi:hypothetical protein
VRLLTDLILADQLASNYCHAHLSANSGLFCFAVTEGSSRTEDDVEALRMAG